MGTFTFLPGTGGENGIGFLFTVVQNITDYPLDVRSMSWQVLLLLFTLAVQEKRQRGEIEREGEGERERMGRGRKS